MKSFDEYQDFTDTTSFAFRDAVYKLVEDAFMLEEEMPGEGKALLCDVLCLHYLAGKLNGEAGELAEQVFKATRDDGGLLSEERLVNISKEIGDVQWYSAQLSRQIGRRFSAVVDDNVTKLQSRLDRDLLHGSGDNR